MIRAWNQDQSQKRRKIDENLSPQKILVGQNLVKTVKMARKIIVVPSSCSNISNNDIVSSLSATMSDQNIQVEMKGINEIADLQGSQ